MSSPLRLVVLGMMGRSPFAGQAWLYLNWLSGLRGLGHDVYYVEDDIVWMFDPERNALTADCDYAVRHVAGCMDRIGMGDRWAVRFGLDGGGCWGMSEAELRELYRSSDAVLNIVGATELRDEHLALEAPFRVYVETDPAVAEIKLANGDPVVRTNFDRHHAFATYGENYGAPDCPVPLHGIDFVATRQPVDLEWWPMASVPGADAFTTIGNYRQNGQDLTWGGETYRWSKHHEWRKVLDLPQVTGSRFQIASTWRNEEDRRRLERHGWGTVDALELSLDVFGAYPSFIRSSRAELTVAKDLNVRLRTGWFSERDACYLASGKPVIAQDTGFGRTLPTGEGLFGFATREEAIESVRAVEEDPERHAKAARAIAEEHFEARDVARRLLEGVGLT